ncbi:hypothetical protein [Vibrio fluvialis]|uniref:hypothetical protein n=1 Tax=Vibrio fluvialis TaxID=676 RepID=UPI0013021881|nr:hypothetical protein [Vibrio fluvialis]ELG4657080.1 hypothetical protein [Vibrio fluvialis]ELW1732313.1 hypothetical protein [Vibrio fluvialis]MCE7648560.1 hypothetical protein [Vibrio fluvialis]
MKVLVACEESQVVTTALRKLGHEAYSCDLVECSGNHPEWHIQQDAVEVAYADQWDMMIAHPPCTRLCNAGVRWLREPPKGKSLVELWKEFFDGVELYKSLRNAPIPKIALENPIMHCYAKEALGVIDRHVVQPWWFGDKAFKATGFELINLPTLEPTNKLIPPKPGTDEHKQWSFIHRMSPGYERSKARSKTFQGVAQAMAEQWAGTDIQSS